MFQSFDQTSSPEHGASRLDALRHEMRAAQVDGFWVPRADRFQGEYVAACDSRLAWLTGFTGSAGHCVALHDQAAVFADGRYKVQVRDQIDQEVFTAVDWPATSVGAWVTQNLDKGTLGFDPWLHTVEQINTMEKALAPKGIALCPCDNLIDRIWHDQPAPPNGAARPYPLDLAGQSYQDKCAHIAQSLKDAGHASVIISMPDSLCWLLNIRGQDVAHNPIVHATCILHSDATVDLFLAPEKRAKLEGHFDESIRLHAPSAYLDVVAGLTGMVQFDANDLPWAVWSVLRDNKIDTAQESDPCSLLKACKNDIELAHAKVAHHRDAVAMCEYLAWLSRQDHSKLTEIDVVTALEAQRRATNALVDISFETIAGSGPNAALPHYRVTQDTNRPLKDGEVLLIDSGGQYEDGTTDITRTLGIGAQPDEVKHAFTRVLQGVIAISRLVFPRGISGRDIDAFARMALWQAQQDFDHGTGHGVGQFLSVHEGPQRISRLSTVPFKEGMILSNEPGFYKEGAFGIRIENLIAVTLKPAGPEASHGDMLGFETLTYVPIDRCLIVADMLNSHEREWINTYHQACWDRLHSSVSADCAAWLKEATRPI